MSKFQCSSASRKFLNRRYTSCGNAAGLSFSALQRAENSSIQPVRPMRVNRERFSALQRAENSSIICQPDFGIFDYCFSALQRAENSSMQYCNPHRLQAAEGFQCSSASRKFLNSDVAADVDRVGKFQCSSASRKFLNRRRRAATRTARRGFSALQRAENSSILHRRCRSRSRVEFQCSSASRKFLNRRPAARCASASRRFSALQRAENSSIADKIPRICWGRRRFSALQRAENSSIQRRNPPLVHSRRFQCSSASRKFLNC